MANSGNLWSDLSASQKDILKRLLSSPIANLAEYKQAITNPVLFNALPLNARQAIFRAANAPVNGLSALSGTLLKTPAQIVQDDAAIASAGQIVKEKISDLSNSLTQGPSPAAQIVDDAGRIIRASTNTSGTTAILPVLSNGQDFGTDAELRPYLITQSTPNSGNAPVDEIPIPTDAGGTGSDSDDAFVPGKNATAIEIDDVFNNNAPFAALPNVLNKYSSYTYSASVYLMTKATPKTIKNEKELLDGAKILFQSGGAPINTNERNEFFKLDYYIDKFEVESVLTGKGSNAAHNVQKFSMTVVEPYGISLIPTLKKAVNHFLGTPTGKDNTFTSQVFLLVIRFYGYDENGNQAQVGVSDRVDGEDGVKTDLNNKILIEKYYPFQITDITFKIDNKVVEYEITATSPAAQIAASTGRGSVPYHLELSAITLNDALNGASQIESITNENVDAEGQDGGFYGEAPAKASAAPSPKQTVRAGLMSALNTWQDELVKNGTITYPDRYKVTFVNEAIKSARIRPPGSLDKSKAASAVAKTAADKTLSSKTSVDTSSERLTISPGQQVVAIIEQLVRNSSYIKDQQNISMDAKTQKEIMRGPQAKTLSWYKVTLKAVPNSPLDTLRNDYAYDIEYIISFYKISELLSDYFTHGEFNGVHKIYNYWFTGENIDVIDYESKIDNLYHYTMSPAFKPDGKFEIVNANEMNSLVSGIVQTRSDYSSQGAAGRINDPAAQAAAELYAPGSWANCELTIIGDPAWLFQGEASGVLPLKWNFKPFLLDGTINTESQEALFEVAFNVPVDYNLSNGLMESYKNNFLGNTVTGAEGPGHAAQSFVYKANSITSMFQKGKFTQKLFGSLLVLNHTLKNKAIEEDADQTGLLLQQSVIKEEIQRQGMSSTIVAGQTNIASVSPSQRDVRNVENEIARKVAATGIALPPKSPTSFGQIIGTASNSLQNFTRINPRLATGKILNLPNNESVELSTSNKPNVQAASDDAQ